MPAARHQFVRQGHGSRKRQAGVIATVGEYRSAMQRFTEMGDLDIWYTKLDDERLEDASGTQPARREHRDRGPRPGF